MSTSVQSYNLTLGEESGTFLYSPFRDGDVTQGWNSSYSGSTTYTPGGQGIGTPFRQTQMDNASVTLDFDGTAVYLCFTANASSYTLYVDQQEVNSTAPVTDDACSGYNGHAQTLTVADGLSYGPHTVVLTVSIPNPDAMFLFYGGVVTISAGVAGASVSNPMYIDDRDPGWVYNPSPWTQGIDPTDYDGTHSYVCPENSQFSASYTVTGVDALWLLGTVDVNTFGYTITLDTADTVYNSTNLWSHAQQILFFAGGLDSSRSHTITAWNYDAQQPDGPGTLACLSIDALVVLKSTPPAAPSSTSSSLVSITSSVSSSSLVSTASSVSSSTISTSSPAPTVGPETSNAQSARLSGGDIAGIVVGAAGAVLLGASFLIFWFRRRARSREQIDVLPNPFPPAGQEIREMKGVDSDPPPVSYPLSHGPSSTSSSHTPAASPRAVRRRPVPTLDQLNSFGTVGSDVSQQGQPTAVQPAALQQASTVELVEVLNRRLRDEQADNVEQPPMYSRGV